MGQPNPDRTSRRPYHSPTRRRQAEQTRARILAAARDLFRSAGYATTTIDAIASTGPPRDLVDRIRTADDPLHRLRLVAELTCRSYQRSVPEFELMRGAAAVAPEVAAAAQQVESRRRGNQARLAGYLDERGLLRSDLAPDEATDIIWTLTSYDVYRALIGERHWSPGRYQTWLAETLAVTLLGD